MKILLAPDSFKGSLSAQEAAHAMERGVHRASPQHITITLPISDGGEGFVDAIVRAAGGTIRHATVTGPLGRPLRAHYGIIDSGAIGVVETAAAAGLPLLPVAARDPLHATTFGVGELIACAINAGCSTVIIGAGGSATVDGGTGMLQALGVRFLDRRGKPVGRGGEELVNIRSIDTAAVAHETRRVRFIVAADVTNPLFGPHGAALVYGPQKGADPKTVRFLDKGLRNFAQVIKQQSGRDIGNLQGAGAAGGLAAGAHALLGAAIMPGIDIVLEKAGFEKKLRRCDLVITGEGRTDGQTRCGKAPLGVARIARRNGVPVVCISGALGEDAGKLYHEGFDALFSITDGPMTEPAAMAKAPALLARATENVVRLFCRSRSL